MILGFLKILSFFRYLFEFEFGSVPRSTKPRWSLEVYIFLAGVWWSSVDATGVSLLGSLSLLPHVLWFDCWCVIHCCYRGEPGHGCGGWLSFWLGPYIFLYWLICLFSSLSDGLIKMMLVFVDVFYPDCAMFISYQSSPLLPFEKLFGGSFGSSLFDGFWCSGSAPPSVLLFFVNIFFSFHVKVSYNGLVVLPGNYIALIVNPGFFS